MEKFAFVVNMSPTRNQCQFDVAEIYRIIREDFGYRFIRIRNKGYYLKHDRGVYEVSGFNEVKADFEAFVEKEWNNIRFNLPFSFEEYKKCWVSYNPLRNYESLRNYLRQDFELTEDQLHFLMIDINEKYRNEWKINELKGFLAGEGFTEMKEKTRENRRKCQISYKKVSPDHYLVFAIIFFDKKKSETIFGLYSVMTEAIEELFTRELDPHDCVCEDKELELILEFYRREKQYWDESKEFFEDLYKRNHQ